jgi:hypothetical protein
LPISFEAIAFLIYGLDDGTTTNLKTDKVNKISFTASASSYFYTTFSCETATVFVCDAITFPVKGPSGSTFGLELRTKKSRSTTDYVSYYYTLPTALSGGVQTVTVPFNPLSGADLDVIFILLFKSFSQGDWEIGATQLVCDNEAQFSAITSKSIGENVILSSSSAAKRYVTFNFKNIADMQYLPK